MSAVQTLTPNYLLAMSQQELDELFAQLEPAPFNGIEGVFRGKLLGIKGMGLFPRSVRVLVYIAVLQSTKPTRSYPSASTVIPLIPSAGLISLRSGV